MKAIVVTDQAAGTAGMKLVERPEPQGAALNPNLEVDKNITGEQHVRSRNSCHTSQVGSVSFPL